MAETTRRARIIIEARDNASGKLAQVGHAQDGIGKASLLAKGALIGFAGAALAGVAASVKLGMSMEQTRMSFKTMLGSAEAASKHLEELRAFAAKTPFQFTDLVTASRRLQAFGFEAEKIIPMLRDIGDAVAAMGGGSEMIDRVTLALGQMSAKGKVSAQEMLQLTEAGIPAWRFLSEAIGVSTAEVQKMAEKGLIPADKAIQAVLAGMRQNFGGLMADQAKTASGQLSNVVDMLTETATTLGEALLPAVKSVIENGLLPFVELLKTLTVVSKETGDELVRLSESEYFFEKGLGRTVLRLQANDRLTTLYGEHLGDMRDRLLKGVESQDSFTDEMIRSRDEIVKGLRAMNLYIEAEAFMKSHTDDMIATLARATVESENYAHGMTEADFAMQRAKTPADELGGSLGDLAGGMQKLTKEQKAFRAAMADSFQLAIDYTKANKELADMQAELAALDEEIAKNGPRRTAVVMNQRMTAEERAVAEAKLAVALGQLQEAQANLDPMNAEAALKVATLKDKVADLTGTLGTHTAAVGGATEAQMKQRDALAAQIEQFQRAAEIESATGAFNALTKAYQDGVISGEQYTERAARLNDITHLYTDEALKAAISQQHLMSALSDPSGGRWLTTLLGMKDSLDGVVKGTEAAAEATGGMHAKSKEARDAMLGAAEEEFAALQTVKTKGGEAKESIDTLRERTQLLGEEFGPVMTAADAAKIKLVDTFEGAMAAVLNAHREVDVLQTKLDMLPASKQIRIELLMPEGLNTLLGGGEAPTPPAHPGRQQGGPVWPGGAFRVGERGSEWFVPRMPGFVVNQQQAAGAVAAERGPRSVQNITNNVTINDRLAAALFFEEQRRQTRGRIEDVM